MRRYHMEHLLAPETSTPGSHGFLSVHDYQAGASTRPHLLRGELPPSMFLIDAFCVITSTTQHWTQRRGVLLEALFKISEGYFFGPHHLIMAALLYFEEKVHKKKLQRADAIPLLFPRLLARFWSIWGIHQILSWSANVFAERAPQPADTSCQESISVIYLRTLTAYQSSLAQEMAAIRACQEQMLTTQAQHTAILRQLQHHFDLPLAAEHSTPPLQCQLAGHRASGPS
ncbi:hypothetical protein CK203_059992 [Vitis vinifera]|uniref:Uncharacterized protein n=1 Tax=Vitis vinifera TaxID=29760 RepID=A0A438GFA4_VITVI|nr:hypothetical protein CK203_059992 [Vitis vinifera]